MTFKKWQVIPPDYTRQQILAHELNIFPITAQLLLNRGILTCDEARLFLSSDLNQLPDPFLLLDMDKAVERILFACEHREKVLIHGDYDVDGVTSTVLLKSILEKLGAIVSYYLPSRFKDGYGVSRQAIREARAAGVKLVITVDCGISAFDVVAEANANGGPDIIITDHHQLPEVLPPALAVINPKRGGYPFCDLAGVGVVFKLAQALYSRQTSNIRPQETNKPSDFSHQSSRELPGPCDQRLTAINRLPASGDRSPTTINQLPTTDDRSPTTELASHLDLVCLGTIADVVTLTGENRILVKHGLRQLAKTSRPGLLALIEVCGLNQQKQPSLLDPKKVSFTLVPRLNAAGRMNDASLSADLLTSENFTQAMVLARELDKKNQERQALENKIYQEALAMLGFSGSQGAYLARNGLRACPSGRQENSLSYVTKPNCLSDRRAGGMSAKQGCSTELIQEKVIILDSPDWHLGVIGIVAARLAELFYRPVFLIVRDQDLGKGSARSIPGFNIYSALKKVGRHLTSFGGHAGAAGFSLPAAQIEDFRQAMQNYTAHTLTMEDLTPKLECEMIVSLPDVSFEVVREIERLAPFGYGNPRPLMACLRASVLNSYAVGKEKKHLRLTVVEDGAKKQGIIFNCPKIEDWQDTYPTNALNPTNHQRPTSVNQLPTTEVRRPATGDRRPATNKMAFIFTPFLNEWNNQIQVQLQIEDFKPGFDIAHLASSRYNFHTCSGNGQIDLENKAPRLRNIKRHLFFLPEFIPQKIKTYKNVIKKSKENTFPLTVFPGHTEKNTLPFIDWRQQVNRFDRLTKLLLNNKQTLILVSCPYQTVELAFYLRQLAPQDNDKVAFYHLCLPYLEKKEVFNLLTAEKLKFLVTTPQIAPLFLTREWEQVVIFHLPFHYQSWQEAINVASMGQAEAVYLLFGRQDCLTARKQMEFLAPERDCLAKLYLLLSKQQNKNNIAMKETSFFNQTVKILRAAGLTGVNDLTMQISLRILAELGLINFSKQRLDLKIELLPAPAKKLALLDSITFCYTQQLKKEVIAWQEQALALPLTDLIFYSNRTDDL